MKATVSNEQIVIKDPDTATTDFFKEILSYTDKAKAYQLKRMASNPFQRSSAYYKQLQKEVKGSILQTNGGGDLIIPSGFTNFLDTLKIKFDDKRKSTGVNTSYPWANKPLALRDYQDEAVELMVNNYRGIINFATGLGKTLVAVHAIRKCNKKSLVICPSESIAKQFYDELVYAFGKNKVGFYGDGKKKIADITVGIAASVNKHVDVFVKHGLGLVIIDEVHHVPAVTFYSIAAGLSHVGKMFGLSATDFRSDGKDIFITAGCGHVLIRRDIKWGVANNWLAAPYFIVRHVDTTSQKQFPYDKLKNYKEHVLNCKEMKDRIKTDMKALLDSGKKVLCLVDQVAHGQELATELGIPFATGQDKQSQEYVNQLNNDEINGLVGTDGKVGEGTDTRKVEVLILANFVASKGPVIQALGRGLRLYPGKTKCIVLDYIPTGSDMLKRHAYGRIDFYKEITDKVKVI